jgi:hypothetical protein
MQFFINVYRSYQAMGRRMRSPGPVARHASGGRSTCLALLVAALGFVPLCRATAQTEEIWLLVDTSDLTLTVMQGQKVLHSYENIAIGSNGATREKRVTDERTPLGEFRISAIRHSDRFHLFLAIDYPTLAVAEAALKDGRINGGEYESVRKAWREGGPPPQDTALGGYLGIHGLGAADVEVHNRFNWTNGCIALTNEQIDELAGWAVVGTRISIRE